MRFTHSVGGAVTGLVVLLALSGCTRTSNDGFGGQQMGANAAPGPASLAPQPVASVSSSQLPDPTTNPSQFPTAPATQPTAPATTVASAENALDVTKESMVGNWRVANGASSCDMFLTLTNLGSGSRGGTRGCAGELTMMGSWEVSGKQVILKDRNGSALARVYKTADSRFEGSTNSGQTLSLSR
ncbi:AprI/Inh family metalloprotease inhibitor [Rhizobium sp. CFBP 8762]|uniref:protease inhibitor Inh/omp19 family protein n=1 Tax=Rhizobium sp. CFBP 8762 TaxID=2775279 RepID=UPI00177B4F56|nr:protease inhibitor Inh/omp19 family protein [Rhizobium sp. CFBP 8762]MBD8555492.1 AprI/Inh family metalloprotease inhibitor [Rhizobium sp. CFBP 8762]